MELMVGWIVFFFPWVMLNINGVFWGNTGFIGGVLLRGVDGQFIEFFMERFGVCISIRAELRAVQRGIKMARK